jgi:hypothetical protein
MHLFGGLRLHYYTLDHIVRMSPRVQLRFFPESRVQAGIGYSRNYQFLHRISLKNTSSAHVWVANSTGQRPTRVDNVTAGLYLPALWQGGYLQAEVYLKKHVHVRVHEINNSLLSSQINLLDTPWFADSRLESSGLEIQFHQHSRFLEFSASYTWSESILQNESLNNGEGFYAGWDRRHQLFGGVTINWSRRFSSYISGVYATGTPSYTLTNAQIVSERLGDYRRMDTGMRYAYQGNRVAFEAAFNVFNLTNRRNAWYKDAIPVVNRSVRPAQLGFMDLDVYDLGFHPSFDLVVRW